MLVQHQLIPQARSLRSARNNHRVRLPFRIWHTGRNTASLPTSPCLSGDYKDQGFRRDQNYSHHTQARSQSAPHRFRDAHILHRKVHTPLLTRSPTHPHTLTPSLSPSFLSFLPRKLRKCEPPAYRRYDMISTAVHILPLPMICTLIVYLLPLCGLQFCYFWNGDLSAVIFATMRLDPAGKPT